MFGMGVLRLMRVRGIAVEMDLTALILIGLFTFPLATSTFPASFRSWSGGEIWFAAIAIGLLIFGSILVHELSHALVGIVMGAQVERIRLFIFGGLTYFRRRPASEAKDFCITIAGPVSNLALAAFFFLAQDITETRTVPHVICQYLTLINVGLGIFNLLPGFPMDGGQALRSALIVVTRQVALAAIVVAISGCAIGALLITWAARSLLSNDLFGAMWAGLIAFWIIGGSLQQFWGLENYRPGNPLTRTLWGWKPKPAAPRPAPSLQYNSPNAILVGQIMSRIEAVYSPEITVNQFLQSSVERRLLDKQDAAVLHNGQLVGLVTRLMALSVPPAERDRVALWQICAPAQTFPACRTSDDLSVALQLMRQSPDRPVLVYEPEGQFAGLLTRTDLERYLRTNENNAPEIEVSRPANPYR